MGAGEDAMPSRRLCTDPPPQWFMNPSEILKPDPL